MGIWKMAKKNHDNSTAYSVDRYAHPFFLPAEPAARQPINGHRRLKQWSKEHLGPIPPVKGDGRLDLSAIIGTDGVNEIKEVGEIRFHALGDTGVNHALEAENVSDDMAEDYKPGAGGLNPAFLFHLGDVIYGPDKEHHFGERFYRPYRRYPGKIIAIPGNHDGEVKSPEDDPSLKAFKENFCAATATVPQQASGSGIFRQTMTLPGAYWFLDAPFMRVVGLYSNLLENPGYLEGRNAQGKADTSQLGWLETTLRSIAKMKEKKALVIATHHPPFSQGGHSGSSEMSQSIDEICEKAGVMPHLFLSAHAHSYQRYTRRAGGKQVPYLVVGTGGMPPQTVPDATGEPFDGSTTYDAAISSLGYLYVTVTAHELKTEFWRLGNQHTSPFDPLTIDLSTHVVR
jgi:3',5'-cyclic AMP phosphodiesterase CpdA